MLGISKFLIPVVVGISTVAAGGGYFLGNYIINGRNPVRVKETVKVGKNQGQDNLSQYFPKGNFEETCQSVTVGEDNFLFECTNTNGRNGGTDSQHKNNPVEVIYSY